MRIDSGNTLTQLHLEAGDGHVYVLSTARIPLPDSA